MLINKKRISNSIINLQENPRFLSEQLITYLGNKRSLLGFIDKGFNIILKKLNKKKLSTFDVFSGSGIVSRLFKQYSSLIITNDLENYASIISECYLTNKNEFNYKEFIPLYTEIICKLENEKLQKGIIAEIYAPENDDNVKENERVFYTARNAAYLDTARQLISSVPEIYQKYFLAPLLSEASIHTNTSGVFKGFYKDSTARKGQFGGKRKIALDRIMGNINLPYPVFSNSTCDYIVKNGNANVICEEVPEVDVAYIDPPYNQHPYGSNYFMLNLLTEYTRPDSISEVSGIPSNWKRSLYNKKKYAYNALSELIEKIKARFLLISFNSEGFISLNAMTEMLCTYGNLTVLETSYNVFRGSRNLKNRNIYVKEYLYLLEKK